METRSLGSGNYSKDDAKKYNWEQWIGKYSLDSEKHFVPFVLFKCHPVLFACDEFGNLYSWKFQDDMSYILNNYHAHSSGIEQVALDSTESNLFTLSSKDSTLCQWHITLLTTGIIPKSNVEDFYKDGIKETSEAINRELKYAYNSDKALEENEGDPLVLVKGSRDKQINDNFMREEEKSKPELKPVIGSLVLERVFGIQCANRRNSLRYYYSPGKESSSPKFSNKEQPTSRQPSDELQAMGGQNVEKKYSKYISYYTSHYIILEDPQENTQSIYSAHRSRITCLALHPSSIIFASGECSTSINYVHVWSTINCEAIVVLKTIHESGVSVLDFSFDGSLLLTFGSGRQSLQMFNWEQEREIAFRYINIGPVFDIKFEPQSSKNIIAIGLECIIKIALVSGSLSITNIISVTGTPNNKRIFLCIDFIQEPTVFANTVTAFIGSSLGDVGVLIDTKFSLIPSIAHDGSINVLKLSRALMKPFCMITGGDDDNIKVWDSTMACIATIPIYSFELYKEFEQIDTSLKLGGVQSLDLCSFEEDNPFLLVGMRNGDVLEMIIQFKGEEDKLVGEGKVKVSLEAVMVMGEHSSQEMGEDERKVSICLHPTLPILVSGSYDCTLRFWDTNMNMLLRKNSLGKTMKVSAIAFSPSGTLLTLGFINGTVIFYKFTEAEKEKMAYYDPSIEKVLTMKNSKGAVILIKYSDDEEFVGVSFDAEIVVNTEGKRVRNGQSFVVVYVRSNSSRSLKIQKSKDPYSKFAQIIYPAKCGKSEQNSVNSSSSSDDSHGVFTHMDFSENNDYLQLCYMPILYSRKIDYNSTPMYLLWNLNVRQAVGDIEILRKIKWSQWSIAPTLYGRILGKYTPSISPEEDTLANNKVIFSALRTFYNNEKACAGSKDGDIHLFRSEALFKANESTEKGGVILKDRMEVAKSYSACCSPIECIEITADQDNIYIFISSLSDEVILKYKFEKENPKWDLDYFTLTDKEHDPYSELPTADRFDLIMKECWIPRSRIYEFSEKQSPNPCDARIDFIFGRRACDRRNNLFYDYMEHIIYTIGTMFIILVDKSKGNIGADKNQLVFPATQRDKHFTSPEISCLCTNDERHILALGTAEFQAHIHVWDISHNTEVASIPLTNCSLVYTLKFNKDNKHIAAIALNKCFQQVILIVDRKTIKAMTTLIHSSPYKIRDLQFYPESTSKLITAGIQHLSMWKTDGKYMESHCFDLTMTRFRQIEEVDTKYGTGKLCKPEQLIETIDLDTETVYVTFMGIGFIRNCMITIGDDGCIYIWNEEKILKRKKGHSDCVTCLHIGNELLITGGNDGYVIVWGFNEGSNPLHRDIIQKAALQVPCISPITTFPKPLLPNLWSGSIIPAENCVQSVCLNKDSLLVGTRNGDIYTVEAKISSDEFKPKLQFDGSLFHKLLNAVDEEVPKCISYDSRNKRLLCISQRGHLSVWCLETNVLIESKYFDKPALYIYAFTTLSNTLIVFDNEVQMLNDSYEVLEGFSISKILITAIKVCKNERIIALASNNDKVPELEIYDVNNKAQEVRVIKGHKVNIIEIDFTIDGKYILCQNELGDIYLYDCETLERIENVEEEVKLYWEGLGLMTDSDFTEVSKYYNGGNKICAIAKFPNKNIVAIGDQIGRVFLLSKEIAKII